MKDLRSLPSVDRLLGEAALAPILDRHGRPLTLQAVRAVLADVRSDRFDTVPPTHQLIELIHSRVADWQADLRPLINATGVILHTNLGRAPLSADALAAVQAVSGGYCDLEYDLQTGKRGSRQRCCADSLKRLTGAEDALVVNNNAAAVLLALSALANRGRVVISRSQLVEIGGGFRVPDVMKQSGAKLVEVGTTNRTHPSDYEEALRAGAKVVMRAHASNFKIVGFHSEPSLLELVDLAHRSDALVIDDLGSGALLDTSVYLKEREPLVQDSIAAGADLVCFSGDKLLGGPQAGILVGRSPVIAKLKKHPLARAVRADKTCLAALSATLRHYERDEAVQQIPVWRMIAADPAELKRRALAWQTALGKGEVRIGASTVGGGSLPEEELPTWLFCLPVRRPDQLLGKLRGQPLPVIARIADDCVCLDPRTIFPEHDDYLTTILALLLSEE